MNVDDVLFLLAAGEVDERLSAHLRGLSVNLGSLSDVEADALRDFAGELLQRGGFAEDYSITSTGARLERIIDDLFRP